MSVLKKVLVVDDRYEMLEFLRSTLDLSTQDLELQGVPSAEEGLLEIRQTDIDLLITEVRLPGMSGFDLVRRSRRLKPDLPAIMVTDYSSEQGQQEAVDLGVKHYFQRPLEADAVVAAVNMALYGDLVVYADNPEMPEPADIAVPKAAQGRLETLRADTAASRIVLATASGRILSQVGRGQGIDLPKLATLIAQNLATSTGIAQELSGVTLNTIQYHAGNEAELYVASGGRDYFLAIFFDAQARRGRMGTIWVFAQRAIKDLLSLLPVLSVSDSQAVPALVAPVMDDDPLTQPSRTSEIAGEAEGQAWAKTAIPPFREQQETSSRDTDPEPAADSELLAPTEADGFFVLDETAAQDSDVLDDFWASAVSESQAASARTDAFSLEQARRQGLIPGSEETPESESRRQPAQASEGESAELSALFTLDGVTDNEENLDDFWGEALADHESEGPEGPGISFEEALRKGLIPGQMDSESATELGTETTGNGEED